MNIPKILSAETIKAGKLFVQFSDGSKKLYDISNILRKHPSFERLKDPSFLQNFNIEAGGYALSWDENIDISEYELWRNGTLIR